VEISSPGKDKPMERKSSFDKRPEEMTRSTGKSGKSGPRRWEIEQYRYKEKPTDYQRPLHGDPRSKLERPQLDEHDNDSSDDDGDHGYNHPAFGIGATPDLNVSDSFASDQGTLAGDLRYLLPSEQQQHRVLGRWNLRSSLPLPSREDRQRAITSLQKVDKRFKDQQRRKDIGTQYEY
jgi:hypothetical protein